MEMVFRNIIKSFVILLFIFTNANLENVKNQISRNNEEATILSADNTSCGSYRQGNINTSSEDTGYCKFPDLFSTRAGKCEPFADVECGNRTEPVTPCEYPKSNCTRPKGENASLCTCDEYPDLNYDMCLELNDGDRVWPARHWSPFYVKCTAHRTLPTSCAGHSVIYNFFENKCDVVYEVVNAAYNLSLSLSIPESLYHLISFRPTQTQEILPTYFKPTPTTDIYMQTVLDSTGNIRSTSASSVLFHGEGSKSIGVVSQTTPPLDSKLFSAVMTTHDSSIYEMQMSTGLSISSSEESSYKVFDPSSHLSASSYVTPDLSFDSITNVESAESLTFQTEMETVVKTYMITSSSVTTSVAKDLISQISDRPIQSKEKPTPTPPASISTFTKTADNILFSDSSYRTSKISISPSIESSKQLFSEEYRHSSSAKSIQTHPVFLSSSEPSDSSCIAVSSLTSNSIFEFSSKLTLEPSYSVKSLGTLSDSSSFLETLLMPSVPTTVSLLSPTSFLPQQFSSSSSSPGHSTKTPALISSTSTQFSLTTSESSPLSSPVQLTTTESSSVFIFPLLTSSALTSLSLIQLSLGQLVNSSSVESYSSPVPVNSIVDTSKESMSFSRLFTNQSVTSVIKPSELNSVNRSPDIPVSQIIPDTSFMELIIPSTTLSSVTVVSTIPSNFPPSHGVSKETTSRNNIKHNTGTVVPSVAFTASSMPSVPSASKSSTILSPPLPSSSSFPSSSLSSLWSTSFTPPSLQISQSSILVSPSVSSPLSSVSTASISIDSLSIRPSKTLLPSSSSTSSTKLGNSSSKQIYASSHPSESTDDGRSMSKTLTTIGVSPSNTLLTTSHFSSEESVTLSKTSSETPILPSKVQSELRMVSTTSNNLQLKTSVGLELNTIIPSKDLSSSTDTSSSFLIGMSILEPSSTISGDSNIIFKPSVTLSSESTSTSVPLTTFSSASSMVMTPSKPFSGGISSVLTPLKSFSRVSSSVMTPSKQFSSESSSEFSPSKQFSSGLPSIPSPKTTFTTNKSGGKSAERKENDKTSIAIGVGVGGGILFICIIFLVVIIVLRKKNKRGKRDFFQVRLPPELFMTRSL